MKTLNFATEFLVECDLILLHQCHVKPNISLSQEHGGSSRLLCDIVMALIDSCIVWWISFHKSVIH